MTEPLLQIRGLRTHFVTDDGVSTALNGVDLDIMPGEVLGLVGESGSGKSVTALSILRLVPSPPGEIVAGEIRFRGRDLLTMPRDDLRAVRGRDISLIFQEPMTSLNPVFTIGMQVMEVIMAHERTSRADARARAVQMLQHVGIPEPELRMRQYPHQLSGGMRQRVMIAMALALEPALLIADEPTTALDVTIQKQILDLMLAMKSRRETGAILLITHNLAVVAETCDRVAVMQGGRIQEVAPVRELFRNPLHPYTRALLASLPPTDGPRVRRLLTMPAAFRDMHDIEEGALVERAPGHWVRCRPPEDRDDVRHSA
jgi:ABC-type dipeptide/oligopeptide/nickel transport system ATPase component